MTKVDKKASKWSGWIVRWGKGTWTPCEDTASDSECNRAIDEVLNAEPIGLEGDELVEPEPVEENKQEIMQIANNLRNRETHYKLRESITQDP